MTATLDDVTRSKRPDPTAEEAAARELVRLAREQGLSLTGPDGLLKQLTKTVIETALNEEITEHLGYEKHDPAGQGAGSGNVRNGSRPKTVLTDSTGHVELDVPRDRAGGGAPSLPDCGSFRIFTGKDGIRWQGNTGLFLRSSVRKRHGWWSRHHALLLMSVVSSGLARPVLGTGCGRTGKGTRKTSRRCSSRNARGSGSSSGRTAS